MITKYSNSTVILEISKKDYSLKTILNINDDALILCDIKE